MRDFKLKKKQQKKIIEAIREAELKTSGEIRVYICQESSDDTMSRAATVFNELEMEKTKDRNGVLFLVSVKNHKLAVYCDKGIHLKTEQQFWNHIKEVVLKKFKKGKFSKGLVKGIKMTGEKLKEEFPYQKDDKNELPDEIIWN